MKIESKHEKATRLEKAAARAFAKLPKGKALERAESLAAKARAARRESLEMHTPAFWRSLHPSATPAQIAEYEAKYYHAGTYGGELRKARLAAGHTIEQAAKIEGVSKRLWEYWEKNEKLPPAERDVLTRERLLARWKTKARPPGSSNDQGQARREEKA